MALEAFKILNNQGPVYLHDLLNFKNQNYSFRYTRTAEIPKVRTSSYGLSSFRYSAPKLWNSLPQHLEMKLILVILKVLSVPGMERVVPVLFVVQNSFAFI